jgi:glycosyltransferase involved in cell wall biosynthesis
VQRLRRLVPNARVEPLPNGVDLDHFRPTGRKPEPLRLLFTGNFLSRPNVDAVRQFHRRVLPVISRHCPDVRWELAGANFGAVEPVVASDPRVEGSSALADLRPAFERAAVVVSPLVSGGGIKNKVLEAWAMGKAVVATPLGAAGLRIRDGENLLLAHTPAGFAARTLELLEQPRRAEQLGLAGRATARQRYTWSAQSALLTELLDRVVAQTDRRISE